MSTNLSTQYQQWQLKFVQLTSRERLLSLIAGLTVVLLGGYMVFVEPLLISVTQQRGELQRQQAEVSRLDVQLEALYQTLKQDPNAPLNLQLQQINNQIEQYDEQLAQQTEDLVLAQSMPSVLESVFAQFDSLTLVAMESIAPQSILKLADESQTVPAQSQTTDANLYQHGVRLTLEGSYFDIQRYLQKVESLPWRFYWKRFSYKVADYPSAQVQIEIYTLSTNKAFMGVR